VNTQWLRDDCSFIAVLPTDLQNRGIQYRKNPVVSHSALLTRYKLSQSGGNDFPHKITENVTISNIGSSPDNEQVCLFHNESHLTTKESPVPGGIGTNGFSHYHNFRSCSTTPMIGDRDALLFF
jgi:hypothetical protein